MVAADIESSSASVKPLTLEYVDDISESVGKIVLETEDDEEESSKPTDAPRPFYVYTRAQALHLSKSPLVQCPPGMPDFKDWFG
jgi:zinc finger CCCH domain-containing protein 13